MHHTFKKQQLFWWELYNPGLVIKRQEGLLGELQIESEEVAEVRVLLL